MLHKGEHEAICTFPLDNRNKVKQIQIFVNEQLSCLIHLGLYRTRATIIYAYIDNILLIFNKVSCLLQNLMMIFFLVSHFKGTINKVENDELLHISVEERKTFILLRFRKFTVQNEQLIYTSVQFFLAGVFKCKSSSKIRSHIHSCPKPSVSSIAKRSFSFSCS